jgi:hypothetical protein
VQEAWVKYLENLSTVMTDSRKGFKLLNWNNNLLNLVRGVNPLRTTLPACFGFGSADTRLLL